MEITDVIKVILDDIIGRYREFYYGFMCFDDSVNILFNRCKVVLLDDGLEIHYNTDDDFHVNEYTFIRGFSYYDYGIEVFRTIDLILRL